MKTPEELIKQYNITIAYVYERGKGTVPSGKIQIRKGDLARKNGDLDAIVAAKPEIMAILAAADEAERQKAKEREAKIDAIPGLKEIRAARADLHAWHDEWEASFCDVGGLGVRPRPEYDFEEMYKKYPRAKAYLQAEAYSCSENFSKAASGVKALNAIIDGADPATAIAAMEAEWSDYCTRHMWD